MDPLPWLICFFIVFAQVLDAILVGNMTKNGISNEIVSEYLWKGPIMGLRGRRPTALGYEGCRKTCEDRLDPAPTRSTLELVTTCIFPLAIVFNLPYDSIHRHKFSGTIKAVLNWIGSPQTALTHTIWNVRQIRHYHQMAQSKNTLTRDAFYVLSCLGQFELPDNERFYTALVYGLFRPLARTDAEYDPDQHYTAQLLSMIGFQLRMLRRRSVIPTLASLATFVMAFIFSIVLAFKKEGTGSPLSLGLVYSWLPFLVIFTIIDRNPISADRSAILMSRWLFNVDAVFASARATSVDSLDNMEAPVWWSRSRQKNCLGAFEIKEFIGQGRKIKYCGLVDATIRARKTHPLGRNLDEYTLCARTVRDYLNGTRPTQWYATAFTSLFLVMTEVMMAFLMAFFTPTVGLGCWASSLLLYGLLASVAWVYHLCCKAPGKWGRMICNVSNFLALGWIVIMTGFVLTGGFRTCYCSTVQLAYPHSGGYMMFESFGYYLENFDMYGPWITASVVGGSVPGAVLVVPFVWWMKYRYLWSAEETEPTQDFGLANGNIRTDTSWLTA